MKDILDSILSGNAADVSIIPVMNIDTSNPVGDMEMPETLPILTLRNAILFPETVIPITVGREKSIRLVNEAYKSNKLLGAVAQIDVKTEDPGPDDIYEVGTLGRIIKIIEMPDSSITAIVQGIKRFRLTAVPVTVPYLMGNVIYLNDIVPEKGDADMDALADSIKEAAQNMVKLSPHLPRRRPSPSRTSRDTVSW